MHAHRGSLQKEAVCFVNPLCLKREKGNKLKKRKNLEGYWINIAILNFKIVQTARGFLSVQTGGTQGAQLLRTLLMHETLWDGCKLAPRNSTAHGTNAQVEPWSFEVCAAGTRRTILTRMPPGFLLVGTLWLSPSQSRSDEGSGAVRAFLNSLTGDWTVALKAKAFNSCAETPGRQSVNNEAASKGGKKKKNHKKHPHQVHLGIRDLLMLYKKPPLQYLRYNAGLMEAFGTLSWKSRRSSEFSVEERGRAGAWSSFFKQIFMLFNVK